MICFNAIPWYDIYEIVMSSSNTNECSMYVVTNKKAKLNLDSALLWHCRLRHINKKRIEKLQHDGLLDLTHIKSLEKCVACMSGKMARKPYSHQVERAKDPLRLIYTDVCGPFKIMSRQEAYYFVTFTNDFSRYGYVYFLKHKHEVFETFKVFQKEVEIQLRKTIKSLHSDRGDTSLNHEKDDQEIDEPQSDINPNRRSTRTRRPTDRLYSYVDAEEHGLGDLDEPANYKAALLDPKSDKWLNAMNVKMKSMRDNKRMQNIPYALAVGSIMYVVRCTRPDVAFAQYITSQFQQNPGDAHWTAVKNILKYLRNTKDMFLVYGGAVDWKSTKQSIFATSSTYADYIAIFDASKEAVWIHKFIFRLGVVPTIKEPINMYCDNTRAIAIVKDHEVTKGARHFRAKVHYLRETIKMGDVKIEKVDTYENLANPFTKALAFPKHFELTKKIGMIPASSLILNSGGKQTRLLTGAKIDEDSRPECGDTVWNSQTPSGFNVLFCSLSFLCVFVCKFSLTIPFFVIENVNSPPNNPHIFSTALRVKVVIEPHELTTVSTFIDSRLENIKKFLNGFAPQANEIDMNEVESDSESLDTPLVSPFLDSNSDSNDGEVLNKLYKYGYARTLHRKRVINCFDGDDLAFVCMIGFRKLTAYFDHFLPMNIITQKDVVMGKPFREVAKFEYDCVKGLISFSWIFDNYTFQIPHTIPRLKSWGHVS
uniref:Integrase catalytic domain-containing protein n=1 Tax=Tanacetum cinerariifolium TaxID=118510 RepID=A0A6L2LFN6_TANCI|nr:hypothetical protein [Tanacetum cinerariifolium]